MFYRRAAWRVASGFVLYSCLCVYGCDADAGWQGSVQRLDGTTIVSNPATPMWAHDDGEVQHLEFTLEKVFGVERTPANAILGDPHQLHIGVDAAGNVYVLDGQAKRLVSFASDGTVRWQAGGEGEGPGEFQNPAEIAVNSAGTVVVMNHSRTRVDVWRPDGRFVSSRSVSDLGRSGAKVTFLAGFAGASQLVSYAGLRGGSGSRIAVFDLDGLDLQDQFEWNQLPAIEMPTSLSSPASVLASQGFIYVGSGTGYQFRIYSSDGSIIRHVRRDVEYPLRSGFVSYDEGESISSFGEVLAPMTLSPGYLLVCASWADGVEDPDVVAAQRALAFRERRRPPPLDWYSSFDLYDRDGRLLYSVEHKGSGWPSTGLPQFIGPDNRLYTISELPFPQVRRYRVIVRPPDGA